jgi:hypothetical protein
VKRVASLLLCAACGGAAEQATPPAVESPLVAPALDTAAPEARTPAPDGGPIDATNGATRAATGPSGPPTSLDTGEAPPPFVNPPASAAPVAWGSVVAPRLPTVEEGLSLAQIQHFTNQVDRQAQDLRGCYPRSAESFVGTVDLVVRANGKVKSVRFTDVPAKYVACVEKHVWRWTFPAGAGERSFNTRVSWRQPTF